MSAGKQHAACDECRTRKIKCSGGLPSCEKCTRHRITCIYSLQRPMGRPKKRTRQEEDNEPNGQSAQGPAPAVPQQDTIFNFQNGGPYYTPSDSLDRLPSENESIGNFGENDGLFAAFDPPMESALDLEALPLIADSSGTSAVGSPAQAGLSNVQNSCTCLTDIYLILSELRTYSACSFPLSLPTLRRSMVTAEQVLACKHCPRDFSTASQNLHMTCALLGTIANSFRQLLRGIEQEAAFAEAKGEKKEFRMGEMNPATMHLHTGTLDCPLGFSIELAAQEWRGLAKKAVASSFNGQHGGNGVLNIVQKLEERQRLWHYSGDMEDFAPLRNHHPLADDECEEPTCVKIIAQTRRVIEVLAADIRSEA